MIDYDVAIVGGSVAGAATAAWLAGSGLRLVVLDRARFPRDKPCGEGIMPHGVDALRELGALDRVTAAGAREITGVRYTLADGRSVGAGFPVLPGRSPVALGVRRIALDSTLLELARERGVCVRQGFRVRELLWRGGMVAGVSDGNQEIPARVVVGADGLHSWVRRTLGWDGSRRRPRRYAVVGHVRLPTGREVPPQVEVVLDAGMEAYVTPLCGSEALVALLGGRTVMHRFAGDLAGGYRGTLFQRPRLAQVLAGGEVLPGLRATGPFAARARRVAGKGVMLVGDAAGFLDPITGEGMASALLQARAAASVISRALQTDGPPDLSPYAAAHRRITATGTRLTWIALALCSSARLSSRAMTGLERHPELLQRFLAINCGYAGLGSLGTRGWAALLTGW